MSPRARVAPGPTRILCVVGRASSTTGLCLSTLRTPFGSHHVFCPVPDFRGSLPRCLHTKAGRDGALAWGRATDASCLAERRLRPQPRSLLPAARPDLPGGEVSLMCWGSEAGAFLIVFGPMELFCRT